MSSKEAEQRPETILTPREVEILILLSEGCTSARQIGDRLEIGVQTVKTHYANIYEKLGIKDAVGGTGRIRALLIGIEMGAVPNIAAPGIVDGETEIYRRGLVVNARIDA